ncbi:hypothetical protein FLA_3737 [Filimonas lacunae]|nr:hypothetical protein FLA_3737 [Filimonas lacunae]
MADLEKRLAEERDQAKLAEIRQRIHELRAGLDTTQLPDIETVYKTDH